MDKVIEYFQAKNDVLDSSNNENIRTHSKPLFETLNEPTAEEVGYLIDFQCGHTQRPSEVEASMFVAHLAEAGFLAGKGSLRSPERDLPGKAETNKSRSPYASISNTPKKVSPA